MQNKSSPLLFFQILHATNFCGQNSENRIILE
jgi:hypothetical protein